MEKFLSFASLLSNTNLTQETIIVRKRKRFSSATSATSIHSTTIPLNRYCSNTYCIKSDNNHHHHHHYYNSNTNSNTMQDSYNHNLLTPPFDRNNSTLTSPAPVVTTMDDDPSSRFVVCTECRSCFYCSYWCMVKDWRAHQRDCKVKIYAKDIIYYEFCKWKLNVHESLNMLYYSIMKGISTPQSYCIMIELDVVSLSSHKFLVFNYKLVLKRHYFRMNPFHQTLYLQMISDDHNNWNDERNATASVNSQEERNDDNNNNSGTTTSCGKTGSSSTSTSSSIPILVVYVLHRTCEVYTFLGIGFVGYSARFKLQQVKRQVMSENRLCKAFVTII